MGCLQLEKLEPLRLAGCTPPDWTGQHYAELAIQCRRMWFSALKSLLDDAACHWEGKKAPAAEKWEAEQAFDDVLRAGPMIRHLCQMTGLDPVVVSKAFTRRLEDG